MAPDPNPRDFLPRPKGKFSVFRWLKRADENRYSLFFTDFHDMISYRFHAANGKNIRHIPVIRP